MICQQDSQFLLMVAPGQIRRIELRRDYTVVGRDPACDVWLDDPRVSRRHAALQRRGNAVYVTDLGSSGGTFVGGTAVTGPRELHPGDVVSFASVTARFEPAAGDGRLEHAAGDGRFEHAAGDGRFEHAAGETLPALGAAPAPAGRPADYRTPAYRSHVYRTREAAARTGARWLSWVGSLVLAEGAAIAFLVGQHGGGLARYRLGPSLAGVPAGLVGLALAGAGLLLLASGIALRIAASTGQRSLVRR